MMVVLAQDLSESVLIVKLIDQETTDLKLR